MRQPASLLQGLEQAGILAVGAGSELCSPDAMAAGRCDEIGATAREFAAAYQSASSDRP
jgi:2-keto-3-deoxy-6-phosphogluconate aldolase